MQRIVKLCLATVLLAGTADAIAVNQRRGGRPSKGGASKGRPSKGRGGRPAQEEAPTLDIEAGLDASEEREEKGKRGGRRGGKDPSKFVEKYIEKECPDAEDPVACEAEATAFGTNTLDGLLDASCSARLAIKQAICDFKATQDDTVTCDDISVKCDDDEAEE